MEGLNSVLSANSRRDAVLAHLNSHRESGGKKKGRLKAVLPYEHIWLLSKDRVQFKEVLKSDASINTAAIKHIILNTALGIRGAFSKRSQTCRDRLIRAVFEDLADVDTVHVPHALIEGVQLQKFSITASLSSIQQNVIHDLQEQCKTILDHGLGKVRKYAINTH